MRTTSTKESLRPCHCYLTKEVEIGVGGVRIAVGVEVDEEVHGDVGQNALSRLGKPAM